MSSGLFLGDGLECRPASPESTRLRSGAAQMKLRKRRQYDFEGPDVDRLENRIKGLDKGEVLDYLEATINILLLQLPEFRRNSDPQRQGYILGEMKLSAQSVHVMADELLRRIDGLPSEPQQRTRQVRERYGR